MRQVTLATIVMVEALAVLSTAIFAGPSEKPPSVAVYDANPSHLWNRLYAALLVREDHRGRRLAEDSIDPPLWLETEHLLSQPSHDLALKALDEFLHANGEALFQDPVKRAVLQHDLWGVFDWSVQQYSSNGRPRYDKQKQELQVRLAEAIRRLGLTSDEIKSLPDTYAHAVASGDLAKEYDPAHPDRPFLPPDLMDPKGPWVCISPSPDSSPGVAEAHIAGVSGRSSFFVFMRLPDGRKATYDYFQKLWDFPQPYVPGPASADDQALINPDLPSFPAGTEVALVRRLNLIDAQGHLTPTSITESVQIRVYHAVTGTQERFFSGGIADTIKNSGQDFYEFTLRRPQLFSGKAGGLLAVRADERQFRTFQQQGDDPIEDPRDGRPRSEPLPELQTCAWCHSGGGVRSLNSRAKLLKPNRRQQEPRSVEYGPTYWSDTMDLGWKQSRYDWGLLNGYWKSSQATH